MFSLLGHVVGDAPVEGAWWSAWNWDPLILPSLALVSGLYTIGLVRMWRLSGVGHGVSVAQAGAFGGGIVALFVALISPLDPLSAELSWVHMVQHMALMMISAPLLVLGSGVLVVLWALPRPLRRSVGRLQARIEARHSPRYLLWQPVAMWSLYAVTLWIWHVPALYQAALRNAWVHELQHVLFLVAACLFWRVLLDPLSRLRMGLGVGVLYLFTTSLHATALGVFMALSPVVWYGDYKATTPAWGLTPLEDQQLAGLIMWMPACLIYAVVAAAIFALFLLHHGRQVRLT